MPLADLATLIGATPQNISQFKGLTLAYSLIGGAPTIDGYTALINANNTSNFGAGSGPSFNDENIYINIVNALYQGNATVRTKIDLTVAGHQTTAAKLGAIYDFLVPTTNRSEAGKAYFLSQAAFYETRAAELGITGENGAVVVGFASLGKILVDAGTPGIGDTINDLIAAVNDGTAALPQNDASLTPLETADGTAHDAGDIFVAVDPGDGRHLANLPNGATVLFGTGAVHSTLALAADTANDELTLIFDNGAPGIAQTISVLSAKAGENGTIETLTIDANSTGGVVLPGQTLVAQTIIVTGTDGVKFAKVLDQATVRFDASQSEGRIIVGANNLATAPTSIKTGSGNDLITLFGAEGGDVSVVAGAGDDEVRVSGAQEHSATLGAGRDAINFDILAPALAIGAAVSAGAGHITVSDFTAADDLMFLDPDRFPGLSGNPLAEAQYVEGSLASTASTTNQVDAIAASGGIAVDQAYIAAIQIGADTHLFYDANGHTTAGGVSRIAILETVTLDGLSSADFYVA